MHNSKLKRITATLCMVLVPISVFAAGLGKLNVMSGLGEPLKADIELIAVTPEELSSITAAIASEDVYATQGIEKPASHNTIKVIIAKNASGVPILKLQSAQPINEPFLDMLIQVDWVSGRLLREYTVLLDPPGYTGEIDASTQAVQATTVKSQESLPSDSVQNDTMSGETMTRPLAKSKKSSPSKAKPAEAMPREAKPTEDVMPSGDASGEEYLTHSGDTLAKIARDMKPEGISLEQMLVGLYQSNPDAFQGNNINRLKVGQIIRRPSEEALSAITRREASKEIKVQTANWNAYRNKLAGIVADAVPSDTEVNTQSAGGKIKNAAEDKSMPSSAGTKDVVRLSAGDAVASNANADNSKSLQDKVSALQEEATAREKSVKEAQDRTASLEKQIADMQKLLALKNAVMSDLQKQAEVQTSAEENPIIKPLENAPVATEPAKPAVQLAPELEQSLLDSILDTLNTPLLLPVGGVLAVLGGGWMYLRKKREKNLADFDQWIMTSGALKTNTVFGNTASATLDTGDTSLLTDISHSSNSGTIDSNDVDPIAEAEVYMAYGRDAQAEEILKDAITKEPKRYELHLKLLEMYAASKNVSAFETISGELYTTLGADDPTWAKVAEIGIKLEPNNPLYQVNSHSIGVAKADELGLDIGASETKIEIFAANDVSDAKDGNTIDFEMRDSNMDDLGFAEPTATPSIEEPIKTPVEEFSHTMPGIDIPTFAAPQFMPDEFMPDVLAEDVSEKADELPILSELTAESFEFLQVEEAPAAEPTAEGVLDISGMAAKFAETEASDANDFNFDIPTITPEASYMGKNLGEASIYDLSSINLNLNDDVASNSAERSFDVGGASEPIEVDTKLELVTAYIEMDDKEGAKELLAEVMKEGGATQRQRAKALLEKIA